MRRRRRASADFTPSSSSSSPSSSSLRNNNNNSSSSNSSNSFADSLGLSDLDELAAKIDAQKRHEKLTHLSPFWARKQAAAAAAAAAATTAAAAAASTSLGTGATTRRQSTRRDADDVHAELKNLKELTRDVPSQERFRSARNYLPTASFRTRPRFEEHARRSREGGMQSYEFVNDKGPWISSTKRELKFPMKGEGANTYYAGASTHAKWVDDSPAAQALQKLHNIPFGSRSARIYPFDISAEPLGEGFARGGIVPSDAHAVEETPEYQMTKRQRNQVKRKQLAEKAAAKKAAEYAQKVKAGSAAFRDKVKRDPYGLVPFGDGMSDFRQPGPGPAVSSPDRLSLAKEIEKKAGGKFKGGSRATMPIVGADAPKIWAEPNTLDDLPVEAITQANQSLKGIAPIDKNLKATDFPEYIMPEKQGSDKLTAHRVWAPPPADIHDKKGAQLHYAFGSYSSRFSFDMESKEGPTTTLTLPSDFDVKNPGVPSGVFRCTEQRAVFGRMKEKKSTQVLEKYDLIDPWNVADD
eukprot:INCI15698.1.p1 GENE.INCI15698.1~~INCI15698.1.p1  ORF type:complete len:524 (-),score=101.86 INCI15698.1:1023-2594(-)